MSRPKHASAEESEATREHDIFLPRATLIVSGLAFGLARRRVVIVATCSRLCREGFMIQPDMRVCVVGPSKVLSEIN